MVQSVRPAVLSVRRRSRLAALAVALAALVAPIGAAPADAAAPPPVVPATFGHLTWSFTGTATAVERYEIGLAMDGAISKINTVADYSGNVPVTYDPTAADTHADYGGTLVIGRVIDMGAAQLELGHWLGITTAPGWNEHVEGRYWTGAAGGARVRAYDGPDARINIFQGVFYPYGWDGFSTYMDVQRRVGLIGAMRADMGLSDGTAAARGTYRLQSMDNGRFVSVNATATDVVQKSSSATAEQRWVLTPDNGFWTVRDARNGRALDSLGRTEGGFKVGYRAASAAVSQQWELIPWGDGGWFQLRSRAADVCLDTMHADPGTVLRTEYCNSSSMLQYWRLALP